MSGRPVLFEKVLTGPEWDVGSVSAQRRDRFSIRPLECLVRDDEGRAAIEAVSTWGMSTLQLQVRWGERKIVTVKLSNQAEGSVLGRDAKVVEERNLSSIGDANS